MAGETKEDGELSDDDEDNDSDNDDYANDDSDDDKQEKDGTGSVIQSPPRLYVSPYHDTDDDNSSSAYSESGR